MDIGKQRKPVHVEPIENPVPAETPEPQRERKSIPRKEPARTPAPKRTPVKR